MEAQLRTWKETTMISVIVIIALIIFNIVRGNIQSSEIKTAEKTIAVLPFENLVPNEIFPHNTNVITVINYRRASKNQMCFRCATGGRSMNS